MAPVACASLIVTLWIGSAPACGPPDWTPAATVPPQGRSNLYGRPEQEFQSSVRRGRQLLTPPGLSDFVKAAVEQFAAGGGQTPAGVHTQFNCALCHVGTLFGRTVVGLPRRRTRVEELELLASHVGLRGRDVAPDDFPRRPVAPGLDASLTAAAHALSGAQPVAAEPVGVFVGQTKPLPWWTVKYKTTWLADGSLEGPVVPGIYILGESGRGLGSGVIEKILTRDAEPFRDVTEALFACDPPAYGDFLPTLPIDMAAARRGQKLFGEMCAGCHGEYAKAWDRHDAAALGVAEQVRTTGVRYPHGIAVHDVGTDSTRWRLMQLIADPFNDLPVSRQMGLRIVPRAGYLPPPLVGVWARWPYFHNNSAPSLYAVLTPGERRPAAWWVVDAEKPGRGFDSVTNGFPLGDDVPEEQRTPDRRFDTTRPGASNRGHDRGIFIDRHGRDLLTHETRLDLVEYLKTL